MCYTTWVFACEVDVLFGRPSKETPFSLFLQCFSPFIHLFPHFACLFGISLRNSWVVQALGVADKQPDGGARCKRVETIEIERSPNARLFERFNMAIDRPF